MGLGKPVVPDEYTTHSGWSKGSDSMRSSAGALTTSLQSTPPRSASALALRSRQGKSTQRSTLGSPSSSVATASRRSKRLPPQW